MLKLTLEAIELVDAIGTPFTRVDYKSVAPWPSLLLSLIHI